MHETSNWRTGWWLVVAAHTVQQKNKYEQNKKKQCVPSGVLSVSLVCSGSLCGYIPLGIRCHCQSDIPTFHHLVQHHSG